MTPSLDNMPDVVVNLILEHLDFTSMETLRKVNWSLRNSIENQSNHGIKEIDIRFDPEKIVIWIDGTTRIQYENHDKGTSIFCHVDLNSEDFIQKYSRNSNFLDVFFRDLERYFLRNQRVILKEFCVYCDYFDGNQMEDREDYNIFLRALRQFFEAGTKAIKAKNVSIGLTNQEDLMNILSCVDSQLLSKVFIVNELKKETKLEIDEFVKNWKQCIHLKIPRFFVSPTILKNISHLAEFEIVLRHVEAEDLMILKTQFMISNTLKNAKIYYESPEEKELVRPFGNVYYKDFGLGMPFKNWFFSYPNQQYALSISAYNFCRKQIRFEKISIDSVREGLLIPE
ncbi:unnamed protein product [Caenorhabditis brenneri]